MNSDDRQFIDSVRRDLDRVLEETPPEVSHRLRAARQSVLDQQRRRAWQARVPVMAAAMLVLVVAGGVWLGQVPEPAGPVVADAVQQAGDFEMLTGGDDFALYNDLDFYLWLDKRGMDAG